MRTLWSFAVLVAAAAAAFAAVAPARACATAPRAGAEVRIADETAIIVWDREAHREHFIRRATFHTATPDFGFLVPTPTKPELAEVPDGVFERLEQATKPEVVRLREHRLVPGALLGSFLSRGSAPEAAGVAASVRVLDERRVAGFDAVVLEADDARALAAWLGAHGYAQRPALVEWLAPYVAERWKLTAFKVAPRDVTAVAAGAGPSELETGAVRMSFAAERPFYPYREPSDQRESANVAAGAAPERLLRIFFFDRARVSGEIGAARGRWPGETRWANPVDAPFLASIQPFPVPLPEGAWLTELEDRASPRPGVADVFFVTAASGARVKPPALVLVDEQRLTVPLDLLGALVLGGWLLVRRSRRRAAQRLR